MQLKTLKDNIKYETYFSLFKQKFPYLNKTDDFNIKIVSLVDKYGPISWLDLQNLIWSKSKTKEWYQYNFGLNLRHNCEFMFNKKRVGKYILFSTNEIGKAFLYYIKNI